MVITFPSYPSDLAYAMITAAVCQIYPDFEGGNLLGEFLCFLKMMHHARPNVELVTSIGVRIHTNKKDVPSNTEITSTLMIC